MPKSNELVIDDFFKGIGPSPHLGFGDMRNLDIWTTPGVARINNLTVKESASVVVDLIKWIVKNPRNSQELFGLGDTGTVYTSTNYGDTWAVVAGNTLTSAFGQGLAIWKDYLFVARSTTLDVYGPLTAGAAWTNGWKTIDSDSLWHPMHVSLNDGKLYGGAGRYVFSLEELTTFVPATAASFTWTQQALDLPADYRIKCIAELGENLMLGTWMGTSVYDFKIADVFPWDRSSPSFTTPLRLNRNGVHGMINVNNILYILGGVTGEIFSSNGVQSTVIAQIPSHIMSTEAGAYLEWFPCSLISHKGRLFFSVNTNGGQAGAGVWSLLPTGKENILNLEHVISTGGYGTTTALKIPALLVSQIANIVISWNDNTTYGIDRVLLDQRYTSYAAYFESAYYQVGSPLVKRQFTQLEFQLAEALTTGQGIRIKYRTDLSSSFTTIGTYDFATLGGVMSHNTTADIPASEFLQLRVELTTGSNSNTSPKLRAVILR